MPQTVTDLNRISSFTGLGGADLPQGDAEQSIQSLRLSIAQFGNQMEVELDRIYEALRRVNTQAETSSAEAEANAIADGGLWEYVDGELVPKDPDA